MIQRIQSVYLFCSAVASLLMFVIPFGQIVSKNHDLPGHAIDLSNIVLLGFDFPFLLGVPIMIIFACLINILTIFLYKKRMLQIKVCKLNLLVLLGVIFVLFFYDNQGVLDAMNMKESMISYKFGAFLPIIATILTFLASRSIKKDNDLIRSADRIR